MGSFLRKSKHVLNFSPLQFQDNFDNKYHEKK